jgi:hypothetical protein
MPTKDGVMSTAAQTTRAARETHDLRKNADQGQGDEQGSRVGKGSI